MGTSERVDSLAKAERIPVPVEVDMRDLTQSMHAGGGAPRPMSGHASAGHRNERALQNILNRKAVLLSLPADERRPVVFDRKLKARHAPLEPTRRGARLRGPRRGPRRRAGRRSGTH